MSDAENVLTFICHIFHAEKRHFTCVGSAYLAMS